jgi:hypothetical protein
MQSFREGWRSFKAGLDKRLLLEYWTAVWSHAWEVWWGAGVIGVICTIVTLYYIPSRWVIGWAFAWAFLVAGYYTWRTDHVNTHPMKSRLVPLGLFKEYRTWEEPLGILSCRIEFVLS